MADFTMSNLSTENNEGSKLMDFQHLFQGLDFKLFVRDRFGSSMKARGSVREKTALRLLNKEMNNLMEESLTEVHIGYEHLQKLSESNFKDTLNTIKVTFNASNYEQLVHEELFGIYKKIQADALQLLSPKVFKNVKAVEIIIDESIDNRFKNDYCARINISFKESLYLKNLKIVNYSQEHCKFVQFQGDHNSKLEISNLYFQEIGLDCSCCKAHVHNVSIVGSCDYGIMIVAWQCSQSIFEGISLDAVNVLGVAVAHCDTVQLKNISVKNCQKAMGFGFEYSKNLDIQNISICKSKNQCAFIESDGCIQDSIIAASTHGISLQNSQISHRNVSIFCDDDGDVFDMDEASSWTRLE